MVLVGLAFLLDWLLLIVFSLTVDKAVLVTAIVFLLLGLVWGERPWNRPQ